MRNLPAWHFGRQLLENGLRGIELSGGLYDPDNDRHVMDLADEADLKIHNYFPPPCNSFVLNLASQDDNIFTKSNEHIKRAIRLCQRLGIKEYSFHGGFLIDPKPKELGSTIGVKAMASRSIAIECFVNAVNALADYAAGYDVSILVENNVLTSSNLEAFGSNPLLMTESDECIEIMEKTRPNVGLLIDVAHLNVTAKTLDLCKKSFLADCLPWIRGYHLSDNDGYCDSNMPVHLSSWFWPYIQRAIDYVTLEVYTQDIKLLSRQFDLASLILER